MFDPILLRIINNYKYILQHNTILKCFPLQLYIADDNRQPYIRPRFKWLMSNDRIARFFLETLLEQDILEVHLKPQELPYFNKEDDASLSAALTVMRLGFVATIKTAMENMKKF